MLKSKICAHCGRSIEARKKWLKNWEQLKYCSDKCRSSKTQNSYEKEILDLLRKRGSGKTICPSEVLSADLKNNKSVMEDVRQAARRLVAQGFIVIMQNGHLVDPSTAKGPIRLKLLPHSQIHK